MAYGRFGVPENFLTLTTDQVAEYSAAAQVHYRADYPYHNWNHAMAVASGTKSFPGQFWLTPYAFWYSIKPFSTSGNADIDVFAILLIICLLTLYFPKIPVLNKLPKLLPFQNLREED